MYFQKNRENVSKKALKFMSKDLVIVFAKNTELGKVKTRLAKTIGNQSALNIYTELVKITKKIVSKIEADKRVYFSNFIDDDKWEGFEKFKQEGDNLGAKMKNAFEEGFNDGYKQIILIGTDLPDITANHIENAFKALENFDTVFGPAKDGGYYLIGLAKIQDCIFDNMPWSQSNLMETTKHKLKQFNISYDILELLNDIDTVEDLLTSNFYKMNPKLQENIKQFDD